MWFWMLFVDVLFVYALKTKQESLFRRAEGFFPSKRVKCRADPKKIPNAAHQSRQLVPWQPLRRWKRGEVVGAIRSSHFSVDPARYVKCIEMNLQTYSSVVLGVRVPTSPIVVLLEPETDGWGWNHWGTKSFINFDGTKPPVGRVWFYALPQMLSINKIM